MLLNPAIRRIAILLENIPAASRAKVKFVWAGWWDDKQRAHMTEATMSMDHADIETNTLHLKGGTIRVPLDDVEAVWDNGGGEWKIGVSGPFDPNAACKYETRPRR